MPVLDADDRAGGKRQKNYRRAIDYLPANVPSDANFAQLTRLYAGLAMGALEFPTQARAEVEALRLQPLSPLVVPTRRFGEELARAAARERRLSGELRFGLFYDSNVPVVPNASSDLVAQVLRQHQAQRDSPGELGSLNLACTWLRSFDWEGTEAYRFLQTYNNQLPDFNVQNNTPTVGLVYRGRLLDAPYFAGLQMAYDFITLGGETFVQRGIANHYFSLFATPGNLATVEVRVQVKDFLMMRTSSRTGCVMVSIISSGRGTSFSLKRDVIFSRQAISSNTTLPRAVTGNTPDITSFSALSTRCRGRISAWAMRSIFPNAFYTHNNSLVPVEAQGTIRRRDREAIHLFSVAKDFQFRSQPSTTTFEYLFDDNGSNLASYAYTRHVVTSSLTWRF